MSFAFSGISSCGKTGEQDIELSQQSHEISAFRLHDENFIHAEARYRQSLSQLKLVAYLNRHSVKSNAVAIADLDFSKLDSAQNRNIADSEFDGLRDARFLQDDPPSQALRRLTRMYPDDGCYTRAEYMVKKSFLPFGKIFVFGELQTQTDFATGGSVEWWYHVAPIIKIEGDVYVFDPSVNIGAPLPFEAWLDKINADAATTAALCDSKSYGPYSLCDQLQSSDGRAADDMNKLLKLERSRLEELGMNTTELFGDSPPWK